MPKQNVSNLVSGMGVAMSFVTALVREVQKRGGTDEDIHRLVTPDGETTLGKVADLIVASTKPQLLGLLGTVIIPATSVPFVARDKFVVGNAGIVYVSEQFKTWFSGKTEKPIAEAALRYAKLTRSSLDGPILAELGDKAETTLFQIWALMELQPNGEEGALLTNGWANIFYVNGRAVHVNRRGAGWGVYARSVVSPRGWHDEDRVFSRDS